MSDDINEAIASATNEAIKESTPETAPEPEVKAEPEVEPEVKAEPEAEAEPEEEPLGLSAQQLEAINNDPNLLAAYKSMQRGLTRKTQTLAEQRKELEEKASVADFIRDNPKRAMEIIAERTGVQLDAKPQTTPEEHSQQQAVASTLDELMPKWEQSLTPEGAKVLFPLIKEALEIYSGTIIKSQIEPTQQQVKELMTGTERANFRAKSSAFGAQKLEKGEEWTDEIIGEMTTLMDKVVPSEGVSVEDYLDTLYDTVQMRRTRNGALKAQLKRLQSARTTSEPVVTTRSPEEAEQRITGETPDKDAFSMAVARAKAQLEASM